VSAASIWDAAIKTRLGQIKADAREIAAAIDSSSFIELPVTAPHAAGVVALADAQPTRSASDCWRRPLRSGSGTWLRLPSWQSTANW